MNTATNFFQLSGGALSEDAPSYIERPADTELKAGLEQHELCLVLGPRQSGKSSLIVRAWAQLRKKGVRTGVIDLQFFGSHKDPDRWFGDVIYQIEHALDLGVGSTQWWKAHKSLGPTQRFRTFLEDVVLAKSKGEVVLFFDEIDSVLPLPFSDDFFTTIRSLYNARATTPALRRLTFVLVGFANASCFIRDRKRTPFNVGKVIVPGAFAEEALGRFKQVLGRDSEALLERIYYWTGGQPFLVQKLAQAVASWPMSQRTVARIDTEVNKTFFERKIESDVHFKYIQNYLLDDPTVIRRTLITYRKILEGSFVPEDKQSEVHSRLKLSGIVRVEAQRLVPYNRIYERIFDLNWVLENTPEDILPQASKRALRVIQYIPLILLPILLGLFLVRLGREQSFDDLLKWVNSNEGMLSLISVVVGIIAALTTLLGWRAGLRSKRKAEKLAEAAKRGEVEFEQEIEQDIAIRTMEEIEYRYLQAVKAEHETIRLYGFASTTNLNVSILDVFASLRLTETWRNERPFDISENERYRHLSPEEVLQRALQRRRLLLILGDPGSGKTTLLKYYAMLCLDDGGRQKLGLSKPLIPILVPLRHIDPGKPFVEALSTWSARKHWEITPELFDKWLEKRGALVMLDGLDEVVDIRMRKQVCEWIDNACAAYPRSSFVVTSRYSGYRAAEGIEFRTDHLRADLLDLDPMQQKTFLKRWFMAAYANKIDAYDLMSPEWQLKEFAEQAQEVADAVLQYLGREENASLRQMAGSPTLLQLMAILWMEYGNLPVGRFGLYDRLIDYLLDRRDRAKDIIPLLPAAEAKIVLCPLCLWMQEERRAEEVMRKELEARIAPILEEIKPGLHPSAFIANLSDRAGLLLKFGDDSYVFLHKSFREFLAAKQLAEEVQKNPERINILVENFHDDWWRETLLFTMSIPRPSIFADFFRLFLPHDYNANGFPPLLESIIKESPYRPVEPFAKFILDSRQHWQKRYNALLSLRLIASEPAKALVQRVWEQEKHPRLKQKAEEILLEWKLRRPPIVPEMVSEPIKI
jgi:energy-coupling factor transporter ATP-binding protein EcfA2